MANVDSLRFFCSSNCSLVRLFFIVKVFHNITGLPACLQLDLKVPPYDIIQYLIRHAKSTAKNFLETVGDTTDRNT